MENRSTIGTKPEIVLLSTSTLIPELLTETDDLFDSWQTLPDPLTRTHLRKPLPQPLVAEARLKGDETGKYQGNANANS